MGDTRKDAQLGPFTDKSVTKFEFSPITVTVTKARDASHVPPDDDCGCGKEATLDSSMMEAVKRMGAIIIEHLQKIRAHQESTAYVDPPPPADPSHS